MDTVHGAAFVSAGADSQAGGSGAGLREGRVAPETCKERKSAERVARDAGEISTWYLLIPGNRRQLPVLAQTNP